MDLPTALYVVDAVEPPGDDLVHTEGQMNVKAVNEEAVPVS